ncbi:MAG: hypothetical protein KatS3mg076_3272 [Candidatus Binatia bacterium]|nr:MAG: hypothetical protein KatS3mg076_3272 [Candidatus Binatia bacterium]
MAVLHPVALAPVILVPPPASGVLAWTAPAYLTFGILAAVLAASLVGMLLSGPVRVAVPVRSDVGLERKAVLAAQPA